MDNYDYCAQWAKGRTLDYGCGAGQTVAKMRKRGIDGFGCDVFYGGGTHFERIPESLWPYVFKMEAGKIPFEENTFDSVVTNQVLEHVPDLDLALSEISRVLKPNGRLLALFPDKGVWHEGHCGIPFLHRFPKGSQGRVYYAAALRSIGVGLNKKDLGVMEWSRHFCDWLDKWTHYRWPDEIHTSFSKYFSNFEHIEHEWMAQRVRKSAVIPGPIRRLVARKMAGAVIMACNREK